MEEKEESELIDLREIAISKIRAAYNRSINVQATHFVLFEFLEKRRRKFLIGVIGVSILAIIFIILTSTSHSFTISFVFSLLSSFLSIISILIIGWNIKLSNESIENVNLINNAIILRKQTEDFQNNKLNDLDRNGYIDELKSLEINDKNLKDQSAKFTENLTTKIIILINYKMMELEKIGLKKYIITPSDIDSANQKLQKYTALRTCEAWIKFD